MGVWGISNVYIIKEVYKDISSNFSSSSNSSRAKACHKEVPTKVLCLVGRVFRNRVVTKDNLIKRGVLFQGLPTYEGGCGSEESVSHLFFAGIRYSIYQWIRIKVSLHKESMAYLEQFLGLIELVRASSKIAMIIWFASFWNNWKVINSNVFRNKKVSLNKMIESVNITPWNWLKNKNNNRKHNIASRWQCLTICL